MSVRSDLEKERLKLEREKLIIEKQKGFYLAYLAELTRLQNRRRNRSLLDRIEDTLFDW